MYVLKCLIIAILIGQISFVQRTFAADEGELKMPPEAIAQEVIPQVPSFDEIKKIEQTILETKGVGAFKLVGQRLEIDEFETNGNIRKHVEIDLSSQVVPRVPYADFSHEVTIEGDNQNHNLVFTFWENNIRYRHIIPGINLIAFARDSEMLTVLADDGCVYSIDMGVAQERAFKDPLPVVENIKLQRQFSPDENIKGNFLNRGLKPWNGHYTVEEGAIIPEDVPLERYRARSVVFFKDTPEGRKLITVLDGAILHKDLEESLSYLVVILQVFAGGKVNADMERVIRSVNNPHIHSPTEIEPILRRAVQVLGARSVGTLVSRAKFNELAKNRPVDEFTLNQLEKSWQQAKAESELEQQEERAEELRKAQILDLGLEKFSQDEDYVSQEPKLRENAQRRARGEDMNPSPMKKFIRAGLKSKPLKALAVLVSIGVAGVAAYYGGSWVAAHEAHLLVVQKAMGLYSLMKDLVINHGPYSIVNAEYRRLLPHEIFQNFLWLPQLFGIGKILAIVGGLGKGAAFALTLVFMRIMSVVIRNPIERLAKLVQQPNFIEALRLKINPFKKVKIEEVDDAVRLARVDEEGPGIKEVRPGFNPVSNKNNQKIMTVARNAKILDLLAQQRSSEIAFTQIIAILAVSNEEDIDPAFLTTLIQGKTLEMDDLAGLSRSDTKLAIMMSRGTLPAPNIERWVKDSKFREELVQTRFELERAILSLRDPIIRSELDHLDAQKLAQAYKIARATVKQIKERPQLLSLAKGLERRAKENDALERIGNYNSTQSSILGSALPRQDLLTTVVPGLSIDFCITFIQKSIFGGRARESEIAEVAPVLYHNRVFHTHEHVPETDLAAYPNVLGTNRRFVAENINTLSLMPTSWVNYTMMYYKRLKGSVESIYDPIEYSALAGEPRVDKYGSGMVKAAKEMAKFTTYDMASFSLASLKQKFNFLPFIGPMGIGIRTISGQSLTAATLGYVGILMGWGQWFGCGFLWDINRNGIQRYNDGNEINLKQLDAAKAILSQGLRFNDPQKLETGYRQLISYASDSEFVTLPPELLEQKMYVDTVQSLNPEDKKTFDASLTDYKNHLDEFDTALTSGDPAQVEALQQKIREEYKDQPEIYNDPGLYKLYALNLLDFHVKNPPFVTKSNTKVAATYNTVVSATVNFVNSFLLASLLRPNVNWALKFKTFMPWTIAAYSGTYAGQQAMRRYLPPEKIEDKWNNMKASCVNKLNLEKNNIRSLRPPGNE